MVYNRHAARGCYCTAGPQKAADTPSLLHAVVCKVQLRLRKHNVQRQRVRLVGPWRIVRRHWDDGGHSMPLWGGSVFVAGVSCDRARLLNSRHGQSFRRLLFRLHALNVRVEFRHRRTYGVNFRVNLVLYSAKRVEVVCTIDALVEAQWRLALADNGKHLPLRALHSEE